MRQIIKQMLTENTGSHFLDSDGTYGRNWQRNQSRDFDAEPAVRQSFEVWKGELCLEASISTYHWMNEFLEFDQDLQEQFLEYAETQPDSMPWLALMEEWVDEVHDGHDSDRWTENTYNNPDHWDLSQVLQFVKFRIDSEDYLILQVHGGCDVRGGYTAPKVFRIKHGEFDWYDGAHLDELWADLDDEYWSWRWDGFLGEAPDGVYTCGNYRPDHMPQDPFALPAIERGEAKPEADFWVEVEDHKAYLHGKDLPQEGAEICVCNAHLA